MHVERLKRNRLADEPGVVERPHRRDHFDEAQDSHPPNMIFALISQAPLLKAKNSFQNEGMKCQNFRSMNLEKKCQRQADRTQRAAEHERHHFERHERHRLTDERELQRLAVLRTAEREFKSQADRCPASWS